MSIGNLPLLLTVRQAAEVLNVHPNTIRNWERDGVLAGVRIGNRRDRRFAKDTILLLGGFIVAAPEVQS
ncbi:MAG: helix-turn-helix domain-containing protein [Candidatus Doudnabacteria bacterium]|nr:helix-turn-helix domain-containing protein [Candidatus Doudnabacteria bacterium]